MDSPLAVVRAQWDAWQRLDIDAVTDLWHEDTVWDNTRSERAAGVYAGKAAVLEFLGSYMLSWEGYRIEATGFEAEGPLVMMRLTHGGVPPGAAERVTEHWAMLYEVHDGLVTRSTVYLSQDEAEADLRSAAETRP